MIVCIAEKPSVARDIADVLGAKTKKDGYIEGNGYQVTWTFGHLCTLKEPHEYTPSWKAWSLSSLPMIPPRFGIKLISDPGIEKQFRIIEGLMQNADEIINCGDAGQEGELIQRWVMQKAGAHCPVKRLWISSLTEEAIREGFSKLKDQKEFQPLYEAGLSRAIGDWVLGMNATRLYTLKYGQNRQILSIGRVQTPTLALIVKRQQEIENFTPQQYWVLATLYRETTFSAIIRKSDEELAALREAGYDSITIGIETGDNDALTFMNKGYQAEDIIVQCRRFDHAGIRYNFFYLTGISGRGRGEKGAIDTANICNQLNPQMIGASMLTVFPDSELYKEIKAGHWQEETEIEKYRELRTLADSLNIPVWFAASGASNAIPIQGTFPEDKIKVVSVLDTIIKRADEEELRNYRSNLRHL